MLQNMKRQARLQAKGLVLHTDLPERPDRCSGLELPTGSRYEPSVGCQERRVPRLATHHSHPWLLAALPKVSELAPRRLCLRAWRMCDSRGNDDSVGTWTMMTMMVTMLACCGPVPEERGSARCHC